MRNNNFKWCCYEETRAYPHFLDRGLYASPQSVSQQHWRNALRECLLLGLLEFSLQLALAHLTSPSRYRVEPDQRSWGCCSGTAAPTGGLKTPSHHHCPPCPRLQHNWRRSCVPLERPPSALVVHLKEKQDRLLENNAICCVRCERERVRERNTFCLLRMYSECCSAGASAIHPLPPPPPPHGPSLSLVALSFSWVLPGCRWPPHTPQRWEFSSGNSSG